MRAEPSRIRQLLDFAAVWFFCALVVTVSFIMAYPVRPVIAQETLQEVVDQYEKDLKDLLKMRAKKDAGEQIDAYMYSILQQRVDQLEAMIRSKGGDLDKIKDKIKTSEVARETQKELDLEGVTLEQFEESDFTPEEWSKLKDELEKIEKAQEQLKNIEDPNSMQAQILKQRISEAKMRLREFFSKHPVVWVESEKKFRAKLDGETAELRPPDKFRPWKVENLDSRSVGDRVRYKDFIKKHQFFLRSPILWVRKELGLNLPREPEPWKSMIPTEKTNKRMWKYYFQKKLRKIWLDRFQTMSANEAKDISRVSEWWSKGDWKWILKKRTINIIGETVDQLIRYQEDVNGELADSETWPQITGAENFEVLSDQYDRVQDKIRETLLISQEKWTPQEARNYNATLASLCTKATLLEKKLLWIFGLPANQRDFSEIASLMNNLTTQMNALEGHYKKLHDAWLYEWFIEGLKEYKTFGMGTGQGQARQEIEKLEKISEEARTARGSLEGAKTTLIEEIQREMLRAHIIRTGLERSKRLGTFRPRVMIRKDKKNAEDENFYSKLMTWEEYKEYHQRGYFKVCTNYNETYHEFLSEEEEAEFLLQANKRKRVQ